MSVAGAGDKCGIALTLEWFPWDGAARFRVDDYWCGMRMSASSKDLIVGIVALVLFAVLFIAVDLVEVVFEATRGGERSNLDEIVAVVTALLLVTAWFAARRWREGARLNEQLEQTVAELEDAIGERRVMRSNCAKATRWPRWVRSRGVCPTS